MACKKPLPEGINPANVFTIEDTDALAAELGVCDDQKFQELSYQLNSAASWYHCMRDIEHNTNHAMVRKKLSQLEKTASALLEEINDLDHQSRTCLARGFRRRRRSRNPRTWLSPETARRVVKELGHAARYAIEEVPGGKGRRSRRSLHQMCLHLAWTYEDFSGTTFAREKARGEWTKSACWVARAARIINPKATDSALDTAMRYAVGSLKDKELGLRDMREGHLAWAYEDFDD